MTILPLRKRLKRRSTEREPHFIITIKQDIFHYLKDQNFFIKYLEKIIKEILQSRFFISCNLNQMLRMIFSSFGIFDIEVIPSIVYHLDIELIQYITGKRKIASFTLFSLSSIPTTRLFILFLFFFILYIHLTLTATNPNQEQRRKGSLCRNFTILVRITFR